MLKRVDFYTYPDDTTCEEVKQFLQSQELELIIHDLKVSPLTASDITRLIKHFDLKHFINAASRAFKKFNLDQKIPGRPELIALMAEDNELIRRPIIVSGRLMTVGCNRQKILEMLQIKSNGSDPGETGRADNGHRNHRG